MGILQTLLGLGSKKSELKRFLSEGAVVIDVRTQGEYRSGHVSGSKNIPLQQLGTRMSEIKRLQKPVILCCASGMRSAQATRILKSEGVNCINGGGWTQVDGLS